MFCRGVNHYTFALLAKGRLALLQLGFGNFAKGFKVGLIEANAHAQKCNLVVAALFAAYHITIITKKQGFKMATHHVFIEAQTSLYI